MHARKTLSSSDYVSKWGGDAFDFLYNPNLWSRETQHKFKNHLHLHDVGTILFEVKMIFLRINSSLKNEKKMLTICHNN